MLILAVCGMGLGSSLLLKTYVAKVMQEVGIDAQLEVTDISTARSYQFDMCVTSTEFGNTLRAGLNKDDPRQNRIVEVVNFIDTATLRRKVLQFLKDNNYLDKEYKID